jgi:hypothetical protein
MHAGGDQRVWAKGRNVAGLRLTGCPCRSFLFNDDPVEIIVEGTNAVISVPGNILPFSADF